MSYKGNYKQKDKFNETYVEFPEDLKRADKASIDKVKADAGYNTLKFIDDTKEIKTVWRNLPFDDTVGVCDISCKDRNKEDSTFLYNPEIHLRLRRGHSCVEYEDPNSKKKQCQVLRKGLPKFFYLRESHLLTAEGKLTDKDMKKDYGLDEFKEDNLILYEVYMQMKNYESISILQTRKANGECAHISFVRLEKTFKKNNQKVTKIVEFWSCSSKNVTILVESKNDINLYKEERFYYAKLIAKTWLDFLETKSETEITELKNYLNDHTFVGEYCGNMDLQHVVKYNRICLIFFSIVNKYSKDPCLPLEESYEIFDKFELDRVECKSYNNFKNMEALTTKLRTIYNEVGSSKVEDDGEGNVIYFQGCNPKYGDGSGDKKKYRMLTLCKLKTLEYAFFRKIREKAKNMVIKNIDANTQYKKFHKEALSLINARDLPHDMKYYDNVCKKLFEVVERTDLTDEMIGERFYELLEVTRRLHRENRIPAKSDV